LWALQRWDAREADARLPEAQAPLAEAPPEEPQPDASGAPGISHKVCGHYPNPKPSRDAEWKAYNRDHPDATLKKLGYHKTASYAGGNGRDWTRPQTYHPVFCGASTFRDHATTSASAPKSLREQDYKGGNPGGEPNPEVHRSGPWPYPTWPAYVYWWHQHRGQD
jgi:hypothetical protein